MFDLFIENLKQELKEELPGVEAQLQMAPLYEDIKKRYTQSLKPVKSGSVLLLLYKQEDKILLPLMLRPNYDGVHSGQISFPGGKKEEGDKDLIDTALRETREEIGIDEKEVTVLGSLTELFIPASNFTVLPVVGYAKKRPVFLADPYEVVEIIETNVFDLLDEVPIKLKKINLYNNLEITAPYYDVQGHVVWGATAMMLSEFLQIIKKIKEQIF